MQALSVFKKQAAEHTWQVKPTVATSGKECAHMRAEALLPEMASTAGWLRSCCALPLERGAFISPCRGGVLSRGPWPAPSSYYRVVAARAHVAVGAGRCLWPARGLLTRPGQQPQRPIDEHTKPALWVPTCRAFRIRHDTWCRCSARQLFVFSTVAAQAPSQAQSAFACGSWRGQECMVKLCHAFACLLLLPWTSAAEGLVCKAC